MLNSDSQGFLVGKLLDASTSLKAGQDAGLELLRDIRAGVASLSSGSGLRGRGPRASRQSSPTPPVISPVGRSGSAARLGMSRPEVALAMARIGVPRTAVATGVMKRDSSGKFIAKGGDGQSPGMPKNKTSPDATSDRGGLKALGSTIANAVAQNTDNIDPTIQAMKEVKDAISPLGRGWGKLRQQKEERKKDRWYRRILNAIRGKKENSNTGAPANGEGGGMLGSLAGGAMGMVGRVLPLLGAVLGPVLAVVLAGLAAFGIGTLIHDWMVSSGVQAKLFDAIDWMKKTWSNLIDGAKNLWDGAKKAVTKPVDDFVRGFEGAGKAPRSPGGAQVKKSLSERFGEAIGGASSAIKRVISSGDGTNTVELTDGTTQKRSGTRNWRNHNPGNIEYGDFAIKMGAIGSDGRFAIFPDYKTGRRAQEALIFEGNGGKNLSTKGDYGAGLGYRDKTLNQAIAAYAPMEENDTRLYQSVVAKAVGGRIKKMSEYSPAERAAILDAKERHEGFKVGKVAAVSMPSLAVKPVPSMASMNIPAAPDMSTPNISIGEAVAPVVVVKNDGVGQNVSDRSIAHIVTGGIGGTL